MISIRTMYGASYSAQSLSMFLLRYTKTLNTGRGRKKSPAWEFFRRCKNAVCTEYAVWYHWNTCHYEEPQSLSKVTKCVILYTRVNTSSVCNHVMSTRPCEHKSFTRLYDGNMRNEREETLMVQGSSQMRSKVEDRKSSLSCASDL